MTMANAITRTWKNQIAQVKSAFGAQPVTYPATFSLPQS